MVQDSRGALLRGTLKFDYYYRLRSEGDNILGSVRLSADTLTAEPFDLRPLYPATDVKPTTHIDSVDNWAARAAY